MRKIMISNTTINYDEFLRIHKSIIEGYFFICKKCASYFLGQLNKYLKSNVTEISDKKRFICGNLTDSFKSLGSILRLLDENATYQALMLFRPTIEQITCSIILFRNTNLITKYIDCKQKILNFYNSYLEEENLKTENKRKSKTKFLSNNEFAWAEEVIDQKPVRIHHLLKYINYEKFNNLYWLFDATIHNSINFYSYTPQQLEFQIPISVVVFVNSLLNDLYNEVVKYCLDDLGYLNETLQNTNLLFLEYLKKYREFTLYISVELK